MYCDNNDEFSRRINPYKYHEIIVIKKQKKLLIAAASRIKYQIKHNWNISGASEKPYMARKHSRTHLICLQTQERLDRSRSQLYR